MSTANVFAPPASTSYTPEQALDSAKAFPLSEVLVIGYDAEGELLIRSSKMTRRDALWMSEQLKEWALHGGRE